ncbi:hypothetical protein [Nonomuraea sp. bgisy101]|uniref:hypothetical protein n=1 Tax=Nonomuraea sp. bgisy101 TaxID=3413784 RepID=UPI003D711795
MTDHELAEESLTLLQYLGGDQLLQALTTLMGHHVQALDAGGRIGEYGYRVGDTEEHWIDIMQMLGHWRICESRRRPVGLYVRFWNYAALRDAALAARAWKQETAFALDSEPSGWTWCHHIRDVDEAAQLG